ncbi:unnamed protein product, partial [Ectocarpus fasciculatus]
GHRTQDSRRPKFRRWGRRVGGSSSSSSSSHHRSTSSRGGCGSGATMTRSTRDPCPVWSTRTTPANTRSRRRRWTATARPRASTAAAWPLR